MAKDEQKFESLEEMLDFLAADEQEAIDGYDLVIDQIDDEHIKEELTKLRTEEVAHKEFLELLKEDPTAVYVEPLEDEDEGEDEAEEDEVEEIEEEEVEESVKPKNAFTSKIKEDVMLPDLDANVDLLDLVDDGYEDDYYEAFHIYDKENQINESVLEIGEVVKDSYRHFTDDLGRTPSVDEIFEDIRDNYDGYSDIDSTPEQAGKWYDTIVYELDRQGLAVLDETVFKEALKTLEENEDEVECANCGELVEKTCCTKNADGRYVCKDCQK